ncbi:hypothetical protein AB4Y45_41055 [Paraburkholderia sp. EG287A]|uniref:hypothetical protein n=1 Tax=unclassified Paraburkholderia TaxID=2615204 RepID=UPI0034D33FC6
MARSGNRSAGAGGISAEFFDAVLKAVHAHYVLGQTATPGRRDSQLPMMFMLCGPSRRRINENPRILRALLAGG